ncbi:MAG: aryl-sulfate sulfotransferase [Eudoraea sp.]
MRTNYSLLIFIALLFAISCKQEPKPQEVADVIEVREWQPEDTRSITGLTVERGLKEKTALATPGYVMIGPPESTKTHLVNLDGDVVHTWEGELAVVNQYLKENGNLIRLEVDPDFPTFAAGGQAGRIREYDWDGNILWDFKWADEDELLHHDIELLPNGNILGISYDAKSKEEAIEAGRDPHHVTNAGLWPDKIIEIKPSGPKEGEIIWEWHMWDHLVQDIDSTKNNYGVIAEHPRKINFNVSGPEGPPMTEEQVQQGIKMGMMTGNATVDNVHSDFTHTNAIAYNPELDQIAISVPAYSEIIIIDHSTTTEEAKGNTGGKWGHGGDLLYRWGNPSNYGRGTKEDQKLFFEHDIKWIPKGYPGEGHLMVFNNDIEHPDNKVPSMWATLMSSKSPEVEVAVGVLGNHSAVFEFVPPTNSDGAYIIEENKSFGPDGPHWSYTAPDKYSFYSAFVSGAHRMKNGNTLITSGAKGRIMEVTSEGQIVWEYWNPYNDHFRMPDGTFASPIGPFKYMQFRATHFMEDYPAFVGKDLIPLKEQPEPFIFKMPPPAVAQDSIQ